MRMDQGNNLLLFNAKEVSIMRVFKFLFLELWQGDDALAGQPCDA